MCVLSIKVAIRKKSGNLFDDPRIYDLVRFYDISPIIGNSMPNPIFTCTEYVNSFCRYIFCTQLNGS